MATEDIQEDGVPLRMAKSQKSYNSLMVISGQILEDCNQDLRWPRCMETYKAMFKDATIAPALNFMEMEIAKTEWKVKIPEGYESELRAKADFLTSCMNDMEHTWNDFIRRAATFNRYGFAPIEKVYRRRSKNAGSKYKDNRIGIKSLPLISQDSVNGWQWTDEGRHLSGLDQIVNKPAGLDRVVQVSREYVFIPRNKFMLFRADPQKDSPIGTSPLNGVYVAWRFKTELEKFESTGISQDLRGLKVFKIPARYMSENATEDEKATYEAFKVMLRGLHAGEQSGVIIPSALDQNGKDLFSFELMSVMGQNAFDINTIINRYRSEVVTGILCPQLVLGQNGSGSFALAENLKNLTDTVVGARLRELRDQLNHDLVPQLFALNGWDTEVLPYFDFSLSDDVSLDDLGKFLQRVSAAGMLSNDAETANWIAERAGMPLPFDDDDLPVEEVRQQMTSFVPGATEDDSDESGGSALPISSRRDNTLSNLEN